MQGVRTKNGILWNGSTVPVLVLDLDGTIRYSKNGNKFIEGPDDVAIYDGAEAKIKEYKYKGFLIFGASNQAGVAFGFKTHKQVMAELDATFELLPGVFDSVKQCYHHGGEGTSFPLNKRSLLRKPDYGMLVLMESEAFESGYLVDWDNSLFVGDRPEDQECAINARIPFMWAWDFFGREKP
jgi:D-glycero-D-manno-heptose 1,7-bisphosphate phosphatase